MAFTIEQYEALNTAIAQGALTVKYGDKEVTYRSLTDMLRTRNLMAKELGITDGRNNRRLGTYSKSWNGKYNR